MNTKKYRLTKLACYSSYVTMAPIFSLPPLLFATFHENYGVSYTLLGTLVLANFCTQLTMDLIFSFFSKLLNAKVAIRVMPVITALGLAIYALSPILFPNSVYLGLIIGTIIFSVSAGLSEVLLSPVIAAIPSKDPQKDMSFLHSLYAFGVLFVILVSTVFFNIFGSDNWVYLTLFFAALPFISTALFIMSPIPDISGSHGGDGGKEKSKRRGIGLALCIACIFFGSCAENVMSNWVSGFMETALNVDKSVGDILGAAMFAVLLGLARILYARFGKSIMPVLIAGMSGAAVCYIVAAFSPGRIVPLIACAFTGFFSSMLWPGSLILMEEKLPGSGVAAYAMMAAGGDFGASVSPQLMGIVVDKVSATGFAADIGVKVGLTAEQVGMKAGMLVTSIFPIIGVFVLVAMVKFFRSDKK